MDNKTIKKILALAMLTFNDEQYKKITYLINAKWYNELRVYVEDLLENLELRAMLDSDNIDLKKEIKLCGQINDLVTHEYVEHVLVWES